MSKTFDEIASEQGWDHDSRESLLRVFISNGGSGEDALAEYAQKIADEENRAGEGRVPNLEMDVIGEYHGNAYPEKWEYRITMQPDTEEEGGFLINVEQESGGSMGTTVFTADEAEGLQKMAGTDHSIDAYGDDWTFPDGMERVLTDPDHYIRLDESQIDEVAAWLRYATGEDTWAGGSEWAF
jgi:hypothetical protein